jgi:dihydroorotate dehydrogenase
MGFPSDGAQLAHDRLRKFSPVYGDSVVGVSLGKQKETTLDQAVQDYVLVMRTVYPVADYLAINISSPNTPGLRDLQNSRYLDELLKTIADENRWLAQKHSIRRHPLFVKISPDQSWSELDSVLDSLIENQIDGIIATNTSTSRDGLIDRNAGAIGGLSGRPLAARSNEIIAYIAHATKGELQIIGAGGVFSAQDVHAKIDAGASIVQIYTGLIYEGPGMAGRILRELGES